MGATEPPAIPQLRFEAPLGGAQVETFRFRAYPAAGASGKFSCSGQNAQFFEVAGDCSTTGSDDWEGEVVEVQVKFEPEALGAISDTLVIDGGPQGEYKCLLKGVCRRPEPRGPFTGSHMLNVRNARQRSEQDVELLRNRLGRLEQEERKTVPMELMEPLQHYYWPTLAASPAL